MQASTYNTKSITIQQHYLGCLAQASYTIISEGQVFIIDPKRDIDDYINLVATQNLTPVGIMLTHLHADFVAGHQALATTLKTPIYIGEAAHANYAHEPLVEGQTLTFGQAKLVFWHTPGHTMADISAVLYDNSDNPDKPIAIFSGDALFNGDVGRPDLLAAAGVDKNTLAEKLYDSVCRIMKLPDDVILYPGHGPGSQCGKNLAQETISTIGQQRQSNYAAQCGDRAEFVSAVIDGQNTPPKYFGMDVKMNKEGVDQSLEQIIQAAEALTLESIYALIDKKAVNVIDTRPADEFAAAFIRGSINVGLEGSFASWAGTFVDAALPTVVVGHKDRIHESIVRLARIGIDNIRGSHVLDSEKIDSAHRDTFKRYAPDDAQEKLASSLGVDLRNCSERDATGAIAETVRLILHDLEHKVDTTLPDKDAAIVVFCAGGYRSAIAVSLLKQRGYRNVSDINGGFFAWQAAGKPTISAS